MTAKLNFSPINYIIHACPLAYIACQKEKKKYIFFQVQTSAGAKHYVPRVPT